MNSMVIDYRPFVIESKIYVFDEDNNIINESTAPSLMNELASHVLSYAYSYEAFDITIGTFYTKRLEEVLIPLEKSRFNKNKIKIRSL